MTRSFEALLAAGALLLIPRSVLATDYYVAPSGDDGAPGTEAQPFQSLEHGASVLLPGETLFARAGTYAEELGSGMPGGSSWSAPVTLRAYPGEKPVIQPPPGSARVFTFAGSASSYIVIRDFVLDAKNVSIDAVKITVSSSGGASHHIRLQSCEIMNAPGQGILVTGESGKGGLDVTGNELIDLDVHDNGTTDFDHGFYISTAGNLVDGCHVHANAGWGIHVYNGSDDDADDNIIRNNRSYDNARIGDRGVGIGVYSGSGSQVYNNVVFGNKDGIATDYGATGAGVYNNTVYGNVGTGIALGQGSTGIVVRNNAVWQSGIAWTDSGSGTVESSNSFASDPGFVDAAGNDFHPTSTSPLVDAGESLSEVTTDIDGVTRPQGSAYDIGAYEYCDTGCAGSGGSAGASGSGSGGAAGLGAAGGVGGAGANGGSGGNAGTSGNGQTGSSDDSGGCGCRTTPRSTPTPGGWLPWLLLLMRARRRSRSGVGMCVRHGA